MSSLWGTILLLLGASIAVHGQEYYCPMNDDGCDWVADTNNTFCYKVITTAKTCSEALATCAAFSFDKCESRLLTVDNVPVVAQSMLDDQEMLGNTVNNCPNQLRVDCAYNAATGGWADSSAQNVVFPEGYGASASEPMKAENVEGFTCSADFNFQAIDGNVLSFTPIPFICESCIVEIPVCPEACEMCLLDEEIASTPSNPSVVMREL